MGKKGTCTLGRHMFELWGHQKITFRGVRALFLVAQTSSTPKVDRPPFGPLPWQSSGTSARMPDLGTGKESLGPEVSSGHSGIHSFAST